MVMDATGAAHEADTYGWQDAGGRGGREQHECADRARVGCQSVATATKQRRDWRTPPDPFATVWATDVEPTGRPGPEGTAKSRRSHAE